MALTDEQASRKASREAQDRAALAAVQPLFEQLPVASWTVKGRSIAFPVQVVQQMGANRLIERERPYRDGAKLDDTGSKARKWAVDAIFQNTVQEPGLETNGSDLYPGALNEMIALFDIHETGDLVLPTIGKVRARAGDYTRVERYDTRDAAILTFNFIEDNEDNIDFRSIEAPSPKANAKRLALATEFDEQSAEVWDFNTRSLNTLVSEIEGTVNTPFALLQQAQQTSTQVRHAAERLTRAFSRPGVRGREALGLTRGHRVQRRLVEQQDLAGRAVLESQGGRPKLISVVVTRPISLMALASVLRQSVDDLIAANPGLEDPNYLRAGTAVLVFANAA